MGKREARLATIAEQRAGTADTAGQTKPGGETGNKTVGDESMSGQNRPVKRERILVTLVLFMFTAFVARLVQIQVFEHDTWAKIGRKQSETLLLEYPNRGEIRDRSGVPLAVTLPLTYAVGYRPKRGVSPEAVAGELARHLPMSRTTLRAKLRTQGFTYVARRVDVQVKKKLAALKLPCLQFDEEPRRAYPGDTQAATVVGFCNVDGSGMEGIEAAMNDVLSGELHRELCRVDAHRISRSPLAYDPPSKCLGASVTLTIDVQLQTVVDDAMREGMKGRTYERACALLIEPVTGDILALTTMPAFDPNRPGDAPPEARKCWPITDVYEPGSTLKIVPITKALESGKLSRTSQIFCEHGSYRVRGATLHDTHPYGNLTVNDVLAYSSNIGSAKISEQFSRAEIYDVLRAYGFGNLTLVEMAGEQPGYVPPPYLWSGPTQANLAFGHGLSCTPLQLAMAYASIANGGKLMKPRLVRSVDYPSGDHTEYPVEVVRKVMTPDIAAELTDMLVGVVEHGTGEPAAIKGLRIAGKTGTAQKVNQARKTYFDNRFVSSFVGFFPAEKPKYVLLIVVDDPQGEHYGASVAAPTFRAVVEEILTIRTNDFENPPVPSNTVEFATREKLRESRSRDIAATPVSYSTLFKTDSRRDESSKDTARVVVPNLERLPLRKAIQELSRRRLNFKLSGTRMVITQSPPPGTLVPVGTVCELYGDSR